MEKEKNHENLKMQEYLFFYFKNHFFVFLSLVKNKSWLLTVLIFFLMFLFALKVWQEHIVSQTPKQEIIVKFQNKQLETDQKIKKIERVIEKNKQREENFNQLPKIDNLNEVFNSEDSWLKNENKRNNSMKTIQ